MPVQDWFDGHEKKLRGKIKSAIDDLRFSEQRRWVDNDCKPAKDEGKGLHQLNVKYKSKTEYRIVGFIEEGTNNFIWIEGFLKKNDSDNVRAYRRAQPIKKGIENGTFKTREYDFTRKADNGRPEG